MRGATAAANRPAAAVENPQPPSVSRDDRGDGSVGAVQCPRRAQVSDLFVAVRVAEHHFLDATPPVELTGIDGIGQQALDDRGAAFQRLGGLEERDDVDVTPRRIRRQVVKSREAGEEQGLEDVVAALGHAQDERLGRAGCRLLRRRHHRERGEQVARGG